MQALDPAPQITPKIESTSKAINLISSLGTRVHERDYYSSPAPRNQVKNTSNNVNILKSAYPGTQIPIDTSLAKRNAAQC